MFRCRECGNTSQKWQGKCLQCDGWNTFDEVAETNTKGTKASTKGKERPVSGIISESQTISRVRLVSDELNTVLGGGLTPGSLTLLSGEPGIGKSTLSLQIADWYTAECSEKVDLRVQDSASSTLQRAQSVTVGVTTPRSGARLSHEFLPFWEHSDSSFNTRSTLYISAEENVYQISDRANRLGIRNEHIRLVTASILEDIIETIESDPSDLIIIDSVSMIASLGLSGSSGTISQIRYVTEVFMEFSKRTKRSIILIGHVTKEGTISGPKVLEHLVDTVLFLEGSKYEDYRIIRSLKNRFGPTDEIGLFRMTESGLQDIRNPGLEFIDSENSKLAGSAIGITMEGSRPILIEIEALTTYTKFGYPKRSARGIATGKVDLLLAVLSKWSATKLESYDVYVNVARGLTLSEPGIDLATVAAIISSKKNTPLGSRVFIGEISLTGVVKNVFGLQKRVDEAIKLGFSDIVIPAGSGIKIKKSETVTVHEIRNVGELEKLI